MSRRRNVMSRMMHFASILPMLIFTTFLLGQPCSVYCPVNIDLGDNAGHMEALSVVCYLPSRFQRDEEYIELEAGRISTEDALRHLGDQRNKSAGKSKIKPKSILLHEDDQFSEDAHEPETSIESKKKGKMHRFGEPSVEKGVWALDPESANCPICQDSFLFPKLVEKKWEFELVYKCSQCKDKFYHVQCMNDWLKLNKSCPCCRASFEGKPKPQIQEVSRPQPLQQYQSAPRRRNSYQGPFCPRCGEEWSMDEDDDGFKQCIYCTFEALWATRIGE